MLLDTWDDEQISTHTAISLAFHTVDDGFGSTLRGIRVQLRKQGKTKQCFSILFFYMARLACYLRANSGPDDVLDILSETKVILSWLLVTHSFPVGSENRTVGSSDKRGTYAENMCLHHQQSP